MFFNLISYNIYNDTLTKRKGLFSPMKQMIIHGGKPLTGEVWIGGAKNSTVALIPAAILSHTPVTLECVPRIADVDNLMASLSLFDYHEVLLLVL